MNHDFNERLDKPESKSEEGDDFSLTILRQGTEGETHYHEHIEDWGR